MRDRSWRRYVEEQKVLKRIKFISQLYHYKIFNANGQYIENYKWMDYIGTDTHFMYKTYTCKSSKYKEKWGKKGRRTLWPSEGYKCRIKDKRRFKKMLEQDYGIKHLNISYGFI